MINTETLSSGYVTSRVAVRNNDSIENFIKSTAKEVESYSIKKKKKLLTITSGILTLLTTMTASSQIAMAENVVQVDYNSDLIPTEISEILTQLINFAGKIGILIAILLMIIAGCLKMFGQSEKARKWSVDIIKGFGQILLAPLIIMILVTLTRLLLGNVDGLKPFF